MSCPVAEEFSKVFLRRFLPDRDLARLVSLLDVFQPDHPFDALTRDDAGSQGPRRNATAVLISDFGPMWRPNSGAAVFGSSNQRLSV